MYRKTGPRPAPRRHQATPEPKPRTTGLMSKLHRYVLRTNRVLIKDELEMSILDHLYGRGIIKRDHMEIIKEKKTRRGKATELLDILEGRGPNAFPVFLEELKKTQAHLAGMLKQMEDDAANTDESVITRYVEEGYPDKFDEAAVARPMNETHSTPIIRSAYNRAEHTDDTTDLYGDALNLITIQLGVNRIPHETLEQLSRKLVPIRLYEDLKKENARIMRASEAGVSSSGDQVSQRGERGVGKIVSEQDPKESYIEELETDIKDLKEDALIHEQELERWEEDYDDLKHTLMNAQDDIEHWRILFMNSSQMHVDQAKKLGRQAFVKETGKKGNNDGEQDNKALKLQILRKEREIKETKEALQEKTALLSEAKKKLQSMINEETRLKKGLDLPLKASRKMVRNRIMMLKEEAANNKEQLTKVERKLEEKTKENKVLTRRVSELKRQLDKLEFELRQKQCDYNRLVNRQDPLTAELLEQRKQSSRVTVVPRGKQKSRSKQTDDEPLRPLTSQEVRAPALQRSRTDLGRLFCLLCRNEFEFGKDRTCSIHFRPPHGNKWGCCGRDRHRLILSGCMTLPHLFLRQDIDGIVLTTDGVNMIQMK